MRAINLAFEKHAESVRPLRSQNESDHNELKLLETEDGREC